MILDYIFPLTEEGVPPGDQQVVEYVPLDRKSQVSYKEEDMEGEDEFKKAVEEIEVRYYRVITPHLPILLLWGYSRFSDLSAIMQLGSRR